MAVIFLARAQALNFQIAPANKCRVDKRGKNQPYQPMARERGRRRDTSTNAGKSEKRDPRCENGCDNGSEMVSAYVANEKKELYRNCKSSSVKELL
jgi:hypothetical protein